MRLLGLLAGDTRGFRLAEVFNYLAKARGKPYHYQEFSVSPDFFNEAFWGLRALSAGFNVGAPYRGRVAGLLPELAGEATVLRAVDTVELGSGLKGHLLLAPSFADFLQELDGPEVVLVLGGGIPGLAVALACAKAGCRVHLATRSPSKASPLELILPGLRVWPLEPEVLSEPLREAELVVNATPLGSARFPHAKPPLRYDLIRPEAAAVELVQEPINTPFLEAACRFAGSCYTAGSVLRHFCARAWALWTGDDPEGARRALDKFPLTKYIYYPFKPETPGGSDHEAEAAQGQDNS